MGQKTSVPKIKTAQEQANNIQKIAASHNKNFGTYNEPGPFAAASTKGPFSWLGFGGRRKTRSSRRRANKTRKH